MQRKAQQTSLFQPVDPNVHPDAIGRLSEQAEAILARLFRGPATNWELARIAIRYSARIHDLRKAGFQIETEHLNHASGEVRYTLRGRA